MSDHTPTPAAPYLSPARLLEKAQSAQGLVTTAESIWLERDEADPRFYRVIGAVTLGGAHLVMDGRTGELLMTTLIDPTLIATKARAHEYDDTLAPYQP